MFLIGNKNKTFEETCLSILDKDSSFELKEAYSNLATNVIYLPIEDKCKKIAVTSSKYGEDKSSVAINLAIALASTLIDKKVLLVDADLRNSHIGHFLADVVPGYAMESGLSEYLSGKDDKCNIKTTHIGNLDVVYAGESPINPAGLINSNKMNEFIASLDEKYDYVIIDTPPVNTVSDAILLVGRVNGYIIATKTNYSTVPMLSSASESLTMVGAQIFGVVLSE